MEELLTKSELCHCASSSEDGTSVWDIIVPEEFLDIALEGIAVTIAVDFELFQNEDGRYYYVTEEESYQLMGYAEEVAQGWDKPTFDGFEGAVTREIQTKIEFEMILLPWPDGSAGDEEFAEVEEAVSSQLVLLQWGEEDVAASIRLTLWSRPCGNTSQLAYFQPFPTAPPFPKILPDLRFNPTRSLDSPVPPSYSSSGRLKSASGG